MTIVHVEFDEFRQNSDKYTRQCREEGNLIRLGVPGDDLNMYVVSDHAGVNELLKNDCGGFVHFADYFASLDQESEVDKKIADIFFKNLGNNSGLHLELRKDIRNHFNGGGVDKHIPFIEKSAADLAAGLQDIADSNDGVIDLMEHFAIPLTFLVTSHIIGLEFEGEENKQRCVKLAAEAILLINLLAPEKNKLKALKAHDELSEFILPQLEAFVNAEPGEARDDCLFYDFADKIKNGEQDKLDSFIELVNGLFQAGLGGTSSFFALCLNLVLVGDDKNSPEDIQAYFLDPDRSNDDKREAISEYIRVSQKRLGGIFPRYCIDGGTFKGEPILPRSLIYMSLTSANMDEHAFKNAETVNPDRVKIPLGLSREELSERRSNRMEKSMSFSYGEHMCPGRRIALTIIRYAMDALFTRYPKMAVEEINVIGEPFGKPSEVTSMYIRLNS